MAYGCTTLKSRGTFINRDCWLLFVRLSSCERCEFPSSLCLKVQEVLGVTLGYELEILVSGGSMSNSKTRIDRRQFLTGSAALIGGAAIAPSASSYSRIVGANERISLAHIGPGNRGQELTWVVAQHKARHNVEMTAVCDLWRLHRERAVAENTRFYGRSPRSYQYLEDVLALQDVDAVI